MKPFLYACGILISGFCFSQESSSAVKTSFFDGIVVAGYIDHGAYINFTGPNMSVKHKDFKFLLGMLPSLRIKEDQSEKTKNSTIMPTLGAGVSIIYRKLPLQIPVYYNAKTSTQDGSWKMGIGLGYSFK
ncbi:hypothetical protein [Chryseobacterium daecheongense]|uniref:Outer membrane protein beta-barrel domain-containing protein n=1 Tax=Chryseobacterium daecheongense TaxID=192389 RepID=A0A3N0W1I6_9FLAO|nr:hypothetical protein [Chryseobacterium daecheongense]ROH97978.1 hypothetical protein EGI05_11555 [Chryseobacterium daecheongense]TDX92837.1 hypothetical protein BCF50_1778 [Chryseobacterium daecheongense]